MITLNRKNITSTDVAPNTNIILTFDVDVAAVSNKEIKVSNL